MEHILPASDDAQILVSLYRQAPPEASVQPWLGPLFVRQFLVQDILKSMDPIDRENLILRGFDKSCQ